MNKQALVEYVRTMILNSEAVADNQRVAHFQRVAQGVNYAFDTILSQIADTRKGRAEIEAYHVKNYYNQPVKESNGYRYVGVSDDVVPVGAGKGIWYVQPSQNNVKPTDAGAPLGRMQRPKIALFNSLPIGEAMNDTFWRFGNISDSSQIIIEDIGNSPFTDIRYVDYGVVRALSSYDEEEEVYIPQGRMDAIMQLVMAQFGDVYNDNANNNM